MRRHKAEEFTRGDDLGLLPIPRKMFLISRNQIVRARSIRAFDKYIVVRIRCHFKPARGNNGIAPVLEELHQLEPKTPANPEFRPGKHLPVLLQNWTRNVETGRFSRSQQKDGPLQPCWLQSCRNQYIRVDHQAQRQHHRFFFRARAALMTRSISLDVTLLVPLCSASSPMMRNTSGSGAASRT